jgi:hypothetical protein
MDSGTTVLSEFPFAHDWFFTFGDGDRGSWTFSASVPGVGGCEDIVEITVVAGSPASPPAPPPPAPIPDTAMSPSLDAPPQTGAFLAGAAALLAVGAFRARRRIGR